MKYIVLIYGSEAAYATATEQERAQEMQEYSAVTAEIAQSGKFLSGDSLHPTSTATTVRIRDGKTLITDGPFAETKEQLSGYYVLDCKDLDEAIEYAAKIPGASTGCIEVRPIVIWN